MQTTRLRVLSSFSILNVIMDPFYILFLLMKSDIFLFYAILNFVGLAYQNYLSMEARVIVELKLSFDFQKFA